LIEVLVNGAENVNSSDELVVALFINNGVSAVAANSNGVPQLVAGNLQDAIVPLSTVVTATGLTNIKVRAGFNAGGNWTINNGINAANNAYTLGGVVGSFVKITEIQA
jgi:hypothetical protein